MVEHCCTLVSKARTAATAVGTPSSVEAFLLYKLGAKLLGMIDTPQGKWYEFDPKSVEQAEGKLGLYRAIEERAKFNQAVGDQGAELTKRLQAAIAALVRKTR